MSFMQPQVITGPFIEYSTRYADTYFAPDYAEADIAEDPENRIEWRYSGKWFGRLSSPGYMDCTEWQGPYNTEMGALWDLYDTYGSWDDDDFWKFTEGTPKIVRNSLCYKYQTIENDSVKWANLCGRSVEGHEIVLAVNEPPVKGPNSKYTYPDLESNHNFEIVSGAEAKRLRAELKKYQEDRP